MKQRTKAATMLEDNDQINLGDAMNGEDEAYEEAHESKKRKKAAKAAKYTAAPAQPPLEEALITGPRKVTREVDQNRGLTPHRRKDMKNPRVKVIYRDHPTAAWSHPFLIHSMHSSDMASASLKVRLLLTNIKAANRKL